MNKKLRILALVLALAMVMSFMVGCSNNNNGNKQQGSTENQENGGTDADKTYIIATDTTFAPFEFTDASGKFVGIDVEILAAVAENQGFKYELQSLGFDASLTAVQSGAADAMIAGMSINDERKLTYDFSDPYYDSGVTLAVVESSEIASYDGLMGKKVAVKTGTEGASYAESIKDKYNLELTYYDDSSYMYEAVKTGDAAGCFEDYPVMGYAVLQGNGLKMVGDMVRGSSYGFAVLKGQNAELLAMFDTGLDNIMANGTYQQILEKYGAGASNNVSGTKADAGTDNDAGAEETNKTSSSDGAE